MSTRTAAPRGKSEAAKHALAKRLQALTRGRVTVTYEPQMSVGGYPPIPAGHVFYARLDPFYESPEDDGDDALMDDRKGDLQTQLADELYRIAAVYLSLAAMVRKGGAQ